jgi:xylulokinase
MLEILGIRRNQLPTIRESSSIAGFLTPEILQELGLRMDVPVVAGAGDQAAGAVGIGMVEPGECSIALGTSGVIFKALDVFSSDPENHFQAYAHANGRYHIMAVMLNAAGAVKWWNESVMDNMDYPAFFSTIPGTPVDNGLYFLPYLTGERAPINDPSAKGLFFGLRLDHQKADLNRAVVEGVTFALKESFVQMNRMGIPVRRVRLTGGGAKSPVWAQMIADVFNVEVSNLAIEEGPAFGAAILAMVGNGEYPTVNAACEFLVHLGHSYVPTLDTVKAYEKKYREFEKLYPKIKNLFREVE